uniref:Gag-Pol polyprotein n=1 Tax=Tanacetum cinerariifolium TaxID=118510 RepID=A0A6L2KGG0_TANCI|nr:hypothetical protein [Tanacetum cinerariifolium]
MEAGGKDRPPMLAHGNYVKWKSRIRRYIDTKPNHELIHYCLENEPYKYKFIPYNKPATPGIDDAPSTRSRVMETYATVSEEIKKKMDDEAEAVQIILTRIDNDIYSKVDACPNAMEIWKAIKRLKQGESINVQDHETTLFWEFRKFTSRDGETLDSYYSRFYKMMNELVRNQCIITSHQANVQDDTYDELEDQELEARYMYMEKIQEVILDALDDYGPIFDTQPLEKAHSNNDNYNVFTNERHYPEQPESINDTYAMEQDDRNITHDSSDMSDNGRETNQDDDLAKEHDFLTSLIEQMKLEILENKKQNKCLKSVNKAFKEANKAYEEANPSKKPVAVAIITREPKRTVNQYVATTDKKLIASESTIQKPRSRLRMLCENVIKTWKWWYTKLTPPGYKWAPKSKTGNVNTNVSLPLGTKSRSTNISKTTSVRGSNLSNTPLSSNSFAARRNYPVHPRLWVHKAHDGKSQASN